MFEAAAIPSNLCLNPEATTPDADEFYNQLLPLINPATGIVKYLHPVHFYPSDPDYFCYNSIVASTDRFTGLAPNSQVNTGIGVNKTLARLSTIGECLERYCPAIYDENALLRASYEELRRTYPAENILGPEELEFFDASQYDKPDFPFLRFHAKVKTFWTWMHCLIQKRPMLVPAAMVYLPYVFRAREENFTYTTSTGLAFSSSLEGAILSGLYEAVERDALMIMWYNRLSLPRIDFADVPPEVHGYLQRYYRLFGLERIHAVNITNDIGLPVIFTVVTGNGTDLEPALAVGAACRIDPVECLFKSVMEAFQTSNWARHLKKTKPVRDELGEFKVVSFDQHVQLYTRQENYAQAEFSFTAPEKVRLADMPNRDRKNLYANIQTAVTQIEQAGFQHVLVKDLTSEDVAETGGRVARVIIPKAVPLNLGEHRRCLGVRRIFTVPVKMGWRKEAATIAELNPVPHPFP